MSDDDLAFPKSAITELKTKLAAAEARVKSLQSLLKDICGEWNEDCNPGCSSWGHDGDCKATNIASAKRAMKAENAKLIERLNEFSVHGTDGCKNCETGRITLYAKKRWCLTCLAYNG